MIFRCSACHTGFFFNDTATTEIYTPFPTRRSSDLTKGGSLNGKEMRTISGGFCGLSIRPSFPLKISTNTRGKQVIRSEEHTSELQSRQYLVCRLLLEKKHQQTVRRPGERDSRSAHP